MLGSAGNGKTMSGEQGFSKEENQHLERQLEQTIDHWRSSYELDEADCQFIREKFWQTIQASEAASPILQAIEELLEQRNQKIQIYRQRMAAVVGQFPDLNAGNFAEQLAQERATLQTELGLSDRHTDPTAIVRRHRKHLEHYAQAVYALAKHKRSFVFSEADRIHLDNERQTLSPAVAQLVEQALINQKRQEYHKKLQDHITRSKQLPNPDFWKALLVGHWLNESLVQDIHQTIQDSLPGIQGTSGNPGTPSSLLEPVLSTPSEETPDSKPTPPKRNWKIPLMIAGVGGLITAIVALPLFQHFSLLQLSSEKVGMIAIAKELLKIHSEESEHLSTAQKTVAQPSQDGKTLIAALAQLEKVRSTSPYYKDAGKVRGDACTKLGNLVKGYFDAGNMQGGDSIVRQAQPSCQDVQSNWKAMQASWDRGERSLQRATRYLNENLLDDAIAEAQAFLNPSSTQKLTSDQQIQRARGIIREANARKQPIIVEPDPVSSPIPDLPLPYPSPTGRPIPIEPR